MRRGLTVSWHSLSFLLAAVLYVIFVLPRSGELAGNITPTVGTILRIVTGLLIGLTALPVALNLIKVRKPEFGTPQLALTLRTWSIVGHVLAGVLIIGAAITEIWVSLDDAGQVLFGVYGAAAAIAVLGAAAFYLAFVAEMPPPPPKPLKAKKATPEPAASAQADISEQEATDSPTAADAPESTDTDVTASESTDADPTDSDAADSDVTDAEPAGTSGRLRNRRPRGKTGGVNVNGRRRGGVAVSDD